MQTNDLVPDAQFKKIKERILKDDPPQKKPESSHTLLNTSVLQHAMQNAADNFKQKTGRNMTYSEIRERMG